VRLAREAATAGGSDASRPVRVAGSVPPLAECYRADLVAGREALADEYGQLTSAMASVGVDIWLCETMSSVVEAEAAAAACRAVAPALPLWLSFVLRRSEARGAELLDGTPVAEALQLARRLGAEALLFNCCTPQLVGAALGALAAEPRGELLLGGYGNFWEEHKPGWTIECQETETGKGNQTAEGLQVRDISAEEYVVSARQWVEAGATIVGGCCGIGPEHIRAIAAALRT